MTDLPVYEFGDIQVDLARLTLTRDGKRVSLEPKAFDVLRYLVEHRDRLATKEELLDAVWKDTFVTPNVLTRAVAQLRAALGDSADQPTFVETVPKRGYRFIAEVRIRGVDDGTKGSSSAVPDDRPPGLDSAPRRRARPVWLLLAAAVLIAATAAVWRPRWSATAEVPAPLGPLSPERLTVRMGNNGWPAIAPDGRAVAYVSDRNGGLEIYVVGLASGSGEIAITDDGGENVEPAWSPDGAWIAFHSRTRGGIWIAPATGGGSRQIVETGSQPAWSPDGTRLVFASGEGGMATQSVLWTVNVDGTQRHALTTLGAPPGGHREPHWSGDGKFIAFSVWLPNAPSVWTVPASGDKPPQQVAPQPSHFPVFGPRDRMLYWAEWPVGTSDRLRGLALNPQTGEPVGEPITVMPVNDGRINGLSIASNGTLAFGVEASDINLWAVDVAADGASGEPVRLTNDVVRNSHPDYSSTGRLAYVQLSGTTFSTWVMNDDGSHREPLQGNSALFNPHWSRDGFRLLVSALVQPGTGKVAWVDFATRRLTPVALSDFAFDEIAEPRPSPDGREIAFHVVERSGAMNVWIRALDGSRQQRLTSDAEAISYPAWSPDGRSLAVEIKRGEHTHVGVMSRDGGVVAQLTHDEGQSWPYSWSPDGERIAFAGERSGIWNVYAVSRRTKVTRAMTHFTRSSGYVRYPAWSPRGNRIAFERGITSSGIWTARLH